MPRPRVTQIAQRQSPRAPPSLRTSSSDSDQQNPRPRYPKPTDGRSIRAAQSEPFNQKKLGTRIANLESQLGLAQEELKSLKDQLVSTQAVKESSHDHLDKKPINHIEEIHSSLIETETSNEVNTLIPDDEDEMKYKSSIIEPENPSFDEPGLKNDEINLLKANLDEKVEELEISRRQNERLRSQVDEKSLKISSVEAEIDKLITRLTDISQELEKCKADGVDMKKKLESSEKAKEDLENETKKLRVQSEQWKKAADAAASILAGGMEINGRRISERCGSMDKVYKKSFEHAGGYSDYVGPLGLIDDGFGGESEKRKGSGIRMLGELWRKNGHK